MNISPIDIPIQTVGDCSIEHEIINGRKIHHLVSHKYGLWMSDTEQEVREMQDAVDAVKARGKGLVGGLGLGVVVEMLGAKEEVTSIDVVDNSHDTVDLVVKHLKCKDKVNVIFSDIYDFMRDLNVWEYDFVILDTWQGTGKEAWLLQVMPLRRMIANKFGKVSIHNWAEDIMYAEMMEVLTNKKPYWILDQLPMPMSSKDAKWFLDNVGSEEWEKRYGEKVYDKRKAI